MCITYRRLKKYIHPLDYGVLLWNSKNLLTFTPIGT